MNTIIPRSLWLVPVATLALFGAGCFSPEPTPTPAPTPSAPSAEKPAPTPAPTESTPAPTTPSGFVLPTIDETWRSYTNKIETYSFQYPTKGKYAPTWSVKIVAENDIAYKDGCYYNGYEPGSSDRAGTPVKVTLNGIEFCHVSVGDGFAGGFGLVDIYTTKVGSQIIAVIFEKITHNPGACIDTDPVCKQAADAGARVVSFGNGGRSIFFDAEYMAHLDQIMGTFTIK